MSVLSIIEIINMLLWLIVAANVAYILFFAIASHLPCRPQGPVTTRTDHHSSFLVLFPAYHEDAVILNSIESFLLQDYPKDKYQVVVISDHMLPETNARLAAQPITLLQPSFRKSSKAKALQHAMNHVTATPDYVVVLDADNIVKADFLTSINLIANKDVAIQCHRTAKNADNDIAALDGISEEINNSIFRRGHNRAGLSSALIGSGMCFNYQWFRENVACLDSAVEDRELEVLLILQGIYIHYAEDIHVMDEKVSNSDTFQHQRLRWMTGQLQTLLRMIPHLPKAVIMLNLNYIDKTVQQALIPRSILLLLAPMFTLLSLTVFGLTTATSMWAGLTIMLVAAIALAIPGQQRTLAIFTKLLTLFRLASRMLGNMFRLRPQNKDFIHTTHVQ